VRLQRLKREIGNLPNMITIGRLFLIPPVLWLVDVHQPLESFFAMILFIIASGLDVVDGWLARSRGLVTFFGKFVDPLADKMMVMALLVYLAAEGRVPPWLVVLLLGREFYMSALRTLALGERVEIVADAGGKAKTSFQLIGICFVLVYYEYPLPFAGSLGFHRVGLVFLYISLLVSMWSAWNYTRRFIAELGSRESDSEP
jgi:CDP-diacylglycerol--glycerol-3-phosphate 3-phosphatidyltransferase